jgi:hypothetical protein
MKKLLFALTLFAACIAHAATEVGGIRFDDRTALGNTELVLNGAGLRAKWFLKVYAIGLYAAEKKAATADMLALKGPKRLHIATLFDLTGEQFADALVAGIQKNMSDTEIAPLTARIEQFRNTILELKTAAKGTAIDIDWLPDAGTRLSVNGVRHGADIPGEDFYRALLKIWLGDHPAQDDLKDALLGKQAR